MRRAMVVGLVARREIVERGRSRSYLVALLFTTFLLIGGFVLPALAFGGPSAVRLAVIEPAPTGLAERLNAVATAYHTDIVISTLPSLDAAKEALSAKQVDAALDVPADLSGPGTVHFAEKADDAVIAIVNASVIDLRARGTAVPPSVDILKPPKDSDLTAVIFANAGIILMFIGIFTYGTWVLTGVVEEKQSRVVEVVLSTVRPRDLLMGKVLGIGVLAVGQLVVLVAVGITASQLTGRLQLPPTTFAAVAQLLAWFVLGFAFYSTAMGALGALASRPEEANNAAMPVTMSATAFYILTLTVAQQDPSGLLARVLTFLPPAAPMVVPLRAALGAIDPWEILVSIGLMVVAIALLFEAGARVYSGAVLQGGGRMKLRDAWRAADR